MSKTQIHKPCPVCIELYKKWIENDDIYTNNKRLHYDPAFEERFLYKPIVNPYNNWELISLANFIERDVIGQKGLKAQGLSNYELGIDFEDDTSPDNYNIHDLCEEIAKLIDRRGSKNEAILARITRPTEGVIYRLETRFNFKLKMYDYSPRNHIEILKLLRLIILHERESVFFRRPNKDTKILKLLSNPTLENRDVVSSVYKNVHGKHLYRLKNELSKAVSPDFIAIISCYGFLSSLMWDYLDSKAVLMLIDHDDNKSYAELERIDSFLDNLTKLLTETEIDDSYYHSPLETFYLKLRQHNVFSGIDDLVDILETTAISKVTNWAKDEDYYKMIETKIDTDNLEEYISHNRKYIAKYVLNVTKPTSNQLKKINSLKVQALNIFKMMSIHFGAPANIQSVRVLLLISCYQELIYTSRDKKIKNRYHGWKRDLSLLEESKKGTDASIKAQIAWSWKVYLRFYTNLGCGDYVKFYINIKKNINKIARKINSVPSFENVAYCNELIFMTIFREFATSSELNCMLDHFNKSLGELGYFVEDANNSLLNLLKVLFEDKDMFRKAFGYKDLLTIPINGVDIFSQLYFDKDADRLYKFIESIKKGITHAESSNAVIDWPFKIQLHTNSRQRHLLIICKVELLINPNDKKVCILGFTFDYPEHDKVILNELGLGAFM